MEDILKVIVEQRASDGFVLVDAPITIKVDGNFVQINKRLQSEEQVRDLLMSTMSPAQRSSFAMHHEANYAITHPEYGRFRASAFIQRGLPGLVLRRISSEIPSFSDLGLPEIISQLAMVKRGLVIFVGGTGTGKSTSLAAMLDHRNTHSHGHIVTVEDPIEYLHQHKGCLVTQREVGLDTESYEVALTNTLRQAPDVIMIGEIRTARTMEAALAFAETGHLCLCTLHANNANQALDRIQSFFPPEQHNQVWMDLSLNLRAMVAQQLLPRQDGKGRVPIVEVLLASALVQDHIRKGEVHLIKDLMARSTEQGMQTFDQSLFKAFQAGEISKEEAIRHADSGNDVRLNIKLDERGTDGFLSEVDYEIERDTRN